MIKAVVFDMDGLMFDTETLSYRSWSEASAAIGRPLGDGFINSLVGLDMRVIKKMCATELGAEADIDGFFEIVEDIYTSSLRAGVPPKPGLFELLDWLKDGGYKMALATSSFSELARSNLESAGAAGYFDSLVCGEMVERGKPDPEIYRTAALSLGFAPCECAALDDSPAGIRSAHAAGLLPLMVPDRIAPPPEVREMAAAVLPSLHEALAYLKALEAADED